MLTWRYAMGNSAIPVFTALGTRFAAMLNGVVVVEVVFAWPGVGSLVVRALETRDYPLIQATVLLTACWPSASSSSSTSPTRFLIPAFDSERRHSMSLDLQPPPPQPAAGRTAPQRRHHARTSPRPGATRRAATAATQDVVGAVCTLLVIVPVVLAQVLPLPDADAPGPLRPPAAAADRRAPVRHRPAGPRPALPGPARRPGLADHRRAGRRRLRR